MPFLFSEYLPLLWRDPFGVEALGVYLKLIVAFLGFSFLASSVYILNDLRDKEDDAKDPRKKKRPIASGAISTPMAIAIAVLLLSLVTLAGFWLPTAVGLVFIGYFAQNLFYTYAGKNILILDVFIIALGFVLRVLIGAFVLEIEASPWLLSTCFYFALFLGFFKRYYEVKTSVADKMYGGRYKPESLRNFINITAGLSIMNYSIYTLQGTHSSAQLFWTVPFVVFGIFRYYVLLDNPDELEDGNPSDLILNDRIIIITVLLWMLLCAFLLVYFQ